jgi:hypothetical protein
VRRLQELYADWVAADVAGRSRQGPAR